MLTYDLPVCMVLDCLDVNLVGACHAYCLCHCPVGAYHHPHRALLHRLSSTPPSPTLLTLSAPTWGLLPFSNLGVLNTWHWKVLCFASPTSTTWSRKSTRSVYIDWDHHRPRPHDQEISTCFVYINWAYMVHAAADKHYPGYLKWCMLHRHKSPWSDADSTRQHLMLLWLWLHRLWRGCIKVGFGWAETQRKVISIYFLVWPEYRVV